MRFIDVCQTCPDFQRYQMHNPRAIIVMALTQDQQEVILYTCTKDHTQPMMAIPASNCNNPVFPQLNPPPNCTRLQEQSQHPTPPVTPTPQPDQSLMLYVYTDPTPEEQQQEEQAAPDKGFPSSTESHTGKTENPTDRIDHTETTDLTPPVCLAVDLG
jgi:hypothetical protein